VVPLQQLMQDDAVEETAQAETEQNARTHRELA
jgi:hypothetical protein